jgi:hypothetical protein
VDCLDHEWYLLRFHAYKIGNKKILLGDAKFLKMSEMCFWKGYHIVLTMFYTYKAHENSSQNRRHTLVELLGCKQGAAYGTQEAMKFKIKKMAIINTANEGIATTVY